MRCYPSPGSRRFRSPAQAGWLPGARRGQSGAPARPRDDAFAPDRRARPERHRRVHLRRSGQLPLPLHRRAEGVREAAGTQATAHRRAQPARETLELRGVFQSSGVRGNLKAWWRNEAMQFYILMLGNLIGAASLAGWLVAWAKLDGLIKKPWRF